MSGTHAFVALPPDGSGKQMAQASMIEVLFNNGTVAFEEGMIITFGTTAGVSGTIIKVEGTLSAGELQVRVEEPVPNPIPALTLAEEIRVDAVKHAEVSDISHDPYYFPQNNIVGKDMVNVLEIDSLGAGHVRFSEGSPQFDAFGKLQVSQATTIGEHIFTYDAHANHFTDDLVSGGTLTHLPDSSGILLSTDTTATSKVERISDRYYTYQAGKSQLIEMTLAMGDQGKTNVSRRWGYGDQNDGLFFKLEDTTLNVSVRNSTTGSLVETKIPQADWNKDRLDGSVGKFNATGHTLDVSKDNIYWIDLQWLGAGRVRFGVIINGLRIVCHEVHNANKNNLPYMRTGTLPLYAGQENTGVAGSGSEMRAWCLVVKSEGSYEPPVKGLSGFNTATCTASKDAVMSFRARQTFKGLDNRVTSFGKSLQAFSTAEPVLIQVIKNAALSGSPTWGNPDTESAVEFDIAGVLATNGTVVSSCIVPAAGVGEIDLSDIFNHDGESMSRKAVITDAPDTYTLKATLLNGTTTDVTLTANWKEQQ